MILMHEIDDFTMTQAMKMLPRLQDSFDVRQDLLRKITFYRDSDTCIFHPLPQHIVPVCVGLNITQPYVETNYVFPNFMECKPNRLY